MYIQLGIGRTQLVTHTIELLSHNNIGILDWQDAHLLGNTVALSGCSFISLHKAIAMAPQLTVEFPCLVFKIINLHEQIQASTCV